MERLKPIVKWAGGKAQLLPFLRTHIPFDCTKYMEPFVGGGALFFDQLNNEQFNNFFINDINAPLCYLYAGLADGQVSDTLIGLIKKREREFLNSFDQKEGYYKLRERYNNCLKNNTDDILEVCALFLILNKTAFNGLYRTNRKGEFNVPFSTVKGSLGIDYKNIETYRNVAENKEIIVSNNDYKITLNYIDSDTFAYLDPPYREISATSNFNAYTADGFNDEDQRDLKLYCDKINEIGGKFLLSNSDCPDGFFDDLYKDYIIERVPSKRMINSKGNKRGEINELLIRNYE